MATFSYRAVTPAGQARRGIEEATSATDLERALAARGMYLLRAEPRAPARPGGVRSRRADVVEAVRYLAILVEAGFTLDRALGTTARVVARPDVGVALRAVQERVRGGQSLADALGAADGIFPPLAVAMSRAGERGGHLSDALNRLAAHLEREERIREQLVSALIYPALLTVVGGAALLVLVLYVLPRFATLLDETGAALPRSTAFVLGASGFLGRWWILLLGAVLAGVAVAAAYRGTAAGRRHWDAALLRLPLVGPLRQRLAAARFGRTLSTLLSSGLPILTSLDLAAQGLTDAAVAEDVVRAREEVRGGHRLGPALSRAAVFPYVFLQMVALGEESGQLPEMLDRAASLAEQELGRGMERLVRLVEPILIVVFGAVIGLVALALLQALYGVRVG
jgi:type II secretory pathway component PulF